jgi:hypothetical protein
MILSFEFELYYRNPPVQEKIFDRIDQSSETEIGETQFKVALLHI